MRFISFARRSDPCLCLCFMFVEMAMTDNGNTIGSTGLLALMASVTVVTNLAFIATCFVLMLLGNVRDKTRQDRTRYPYVFGHSCCIICQVPAPRVPSQHNSLLLFFSPSPPGHRLVQVIAESMRQYLSKPVKVGSVVRCGAVRCTGLCGNMRLRR